jgi:hypothetical protein
MDTEEDNLLEEKDKGEGRREEEATRPLVCEKNSLGILMLMYLSASR